MAQISPFTIKASALPRLATDDDFAASGYARELAAIVRTHVVSLALDTAAAYAES